jgi:hypothetical protein
MTVKNMTDCGGTKRRGKDKGDEYDRSTLHMTIAQWNLLKIVKRGRREKGLKKK